ncbi:MAG: RDD family protein [Rhodospirillales bacterium]
MAAADSRKGQRTLITPEGVPLDISLADRGSRFAALLIDLVVLGLLVTTVWALAFLGLWFLHNTFDIGGNFALGLTVSIGIIGSFLIRSFYFCWFEIRWRGSTPGKRMLGIRVADRHGGRLTAEAVIARNIMREIELFLPVTFLLSRPGDEVEAWQNLLTTVWIGIFVFMPFFNRDRLRVGDLVAGTWVINLPRPRLLQDMGAATSARAAPAKRTRFQQSLPDFTFTPAQLSIYGVYELQTLETVLRATGKAADATRQDVARRIARKIDYTEPLRNVACQPFLEAFYLAQRNRLEADLLMGKRKERKAAEDGPSEPS